MKPIETVLAVLATGGLVLAQPAAAARTGSSAGKSEQLAGSGLPGAALPALIAILAVGVGAVIADSNHNDLPVSP